MTRLASSSRRLGSATLVWGMLLSHDRWAPRLLRAGASNIDGPHQNVNDGEHDDRCRLTDMRQDVLSCGLFAY